MFWGRGGGGLYVKFRVGERKEKGGEKGKEKRERERGRKGKKKEEKFTTGEEEELWPCKAVCC